MAIDLFNVATQWFHLGISKDGPCFTRDCGTGNEWNYVVKKG